jgi:hypothetical protein
MMSAAVETWRGREIARSGQAFGTCGPGAGPEAANDDDVSPESLRPDAVPATDHERH